MLRKLIFPLMIVVVLSGAAGVAYASHNGGNNNLHRARDATKQFRSLSVATAAGYGQLLDKDGIACIDMPGMGAMGVHYVNSTLVGDGAIDALAPEAVVYEPDDRGRMRLVALEYVVLKDAWDANHNSEPSLFGHRFDTTVEGNRYGLPTFYSLHVWIYKDNPAGMFAMWNPDVTCTPDDGHDGHGGHGGQMDN